LFFNLLVASEVLLPTSRDRKTSKRNQQSEHTTCNIFELFGIRQSGEKGERRKGKARVPVISQHRTSTVKYRVPQCKMA